MPDDSATPITTTLKPLNPWRLSACVSWVLIFQPMLQPRCHNDRLH